jgi:glycosyltransferase involved in cell wall biosynthesis
MALGKAVLTTPCGARGISGRDGEHFRIVRDEHLWPEEITRLLEDDQMRRALGQRARRLIEERYRWDGVSKSLLQELDGLIPQGVLK